MAQNEAKHLMLARYSTTCSTEKHEEANKPRHATPISRPVFMISRSLNLNPVIDVRSR